jgi:hypothetical protein
MFVGQIKSQKTCARSVERILQYVSSNTAKQSQQLSVNQLYLHQKEIVSGNITTDRQTSVFSCFTKLGTLIYVVVWPEKKSSD